MFHRETSPREEKVRKREQRDHLVGVLIQSLVRQEYFDFEQEMSGIAYQESDVGDPFASDGSCFEFGKTCNQTLVHGRIVYLYKLHESDMAVASDVKSFPTAKFCEWENDCETDS